MASGVELERPHSQLLGAPAYPAAKCESRCARRVAFPSPTMVFGGHSGVMDNIDQEMLREFEALCVNYGF